MMEFTHFNEDGHAKMVDVSEKKDTVRMAIAKAVVQMLPETLQLIKTGGIKKGDVLGVAQVAGIMGAKQTAGMIPMCHPLMLTSVNITFKLDEIKSQIVIHCQVKTTGKTGVEMEAISGASVAALTIYDMSKAVDRWIKITDIALLEKSGGKSGHVIREGETKN
ncbi:cyclic pyranopterin phosphate synthase [Sporomusaceae bacterium BoRhaA]|uniref:cyclic pyranopterin monophosphate synthase MoaC n=1 Tax=Pelorhabdus rhamnosifermentans TaxID=2772457 RepID=UPI001C063A9D|nr:cyclic pyranopterin monophosphate synthase MoaC [Pelorhabdus rhamnosifermentans]MBU2702356.1 cyclic pyranopterin phosphate synthase [Pelorhabdus rhamnosifermentans]